LQLASESTTYGGRFWRHFRVPQGNADKSAFP